LGVTGVIWLTQQPRPTHVEGALDLRQFVADFQSNPNEAQTRLVADFQGSAVTPEEAVEVLKRRPIFLDRVPKDFQLVSLSLLKMPCCTCPQGVYRTPSGRIVCIFEHESKVGILADNCPMIDSRCCGRDVKLGEVGGVLLASWRSNESSITAVGLESMEEVIKLIGSFNSNGSQG
ncbi:hypothetical protein K2X85_05455, partial [bacterium]|nr:hypothetical protein [bacterium]